MQAKLQIHASSAHDVETLVRFLTGARTKYYYYCVLGCHSKETSCLVDTPWTCCKYVLYHLIWDRGGRHVQKLHRETKAESEAQWLGRIKRAGRANGVPRLTETCSSLFGFQSPRRLVRAKRTCHRFDLTRLNYAPLNPSTMVRRNH